MEEAMSVTSPQPAAVFVAISGAGHLIGHGH
jgi:hypothetical protein